MARFQNREDYERWKRERHAEPASAPGSPPRRLDLTTPVPNALTRPIFYSVLGLIVMLALFLEPMLWLALALGLIPAIIGHRKGFDFASWWLYGTALFIVALPHVILKPAADAIIEQQQLAAGRKKCPFCAELIKTDAKVCRYCGRDLPAEES